MLPQFCVKLQDSSTDGGWVEPGKATYNALVRITTSEYDEIIARCSDAALKYMDEEDGEKVRVGSSLELAQRLNDPIPALPRSNHHSRTTCLLGWYSPAEPCHCHIFDINRCKDASSIWDSLKERTRLSLLRGIDVGDDGVDEGREFLALASRDRDVRTAPKSPLERQGFGNNQQQVLGEEKCQPRVPGGSSTSDSINQGSHYFHATRPPIFKPDQPSPSSMSTWSFEKLSDVGANGGFSSGDLTAEAQRQVLKADDDLSATRIPTQRAPKLANQAGSGLCQNRWSSHSKSSNPFGYPTSKLNSFSANDSTVEFKKWAGHLDASIQHPSLLTQSRQVQAAEGPSRGGEELVIQTDGSKIESTSQPSLLEVFDSELAKLSIKNSATSVSARPENVFRLIIDRIEASSTRLQSVNTRVDPRVLPLLQTLEHSINTALEGFYTCIESIADSAEHTSEAMQCFSVDNEEVGRMTPLWLAQRAKRPQKHSKESLLKAPNDAIAKPQRTTLDQPADETTIPYVQNSQCPSAFTNSSLKEISHTSSQPRPDSTAGHLENSRPSKSFHYSVTNNQAGFDGIPVVSQQRDGDLPRPPTEIPERTGGLDDSNVSLPAASRFPTLTRFEQQRFHETTSGILDDASATDHMDAATVAKTQECVDQLHEMGFGSATEGGVSRLVVYAQAARGDLAEAIDLIAEEKQVYDMLSSRQRLL